MSTPAAKRRRVDAANAALRKPFQSPVIRRPGPLPPLPPPPEDGTPESDSRILGTVTGKRVIEDVYSPGSPSTPRKNLGALRGTRPASSLLKVSSKTPYHGSARLGSSRKSLGARAGGAVRPGNDGHDYHDDDDDNDNPFMALAKSHRTTGQEARIKDIDRQLETIQQARKIEDASERRHPGGPVDQELRDLIAKWKGAGRVAADELFEMVRERVDSSGGARAWEAMRQRQMEFYRGFDMDSSAKSKAQGGGGGDDDDGEEEGEGAFDQGEDESLLEKEQRLQGDGRAKGVSDEDEDEPVFNMAMMLRSLNIDLSLLGYDEAEEKWID
ncbi:hypothetical protein VMCG_08331 [Cytospora schulzeri]|uniref:Swi5-dependent recombination DNA repair protein 1 n=1 Tax=Cytospora schulzeri TaxID=448051 RepID=A0A423VVI4_9PEZI|nr:hypothetical protein VMCG_08331 [Valsa malicola]